MHTKQLSINCYRMYNMVKFVLKFIGVPYLIDIRIHITNSLEAYKVLEHSFKKMLS